MPKPYRLPAKPELAIFVAAPGEAMAASQAYAPGILPNGRALLATALSNAPSEFDTKLASFVDMERPWAAVHAEGQQILWLPVTPAKKAELAGLLAPKPPEGKFGAVNLQRSGQGPKVAWLDSDAGYVALADDLRGIATARELPGEYGKQGLFVAVTGDQAKRFTGQAPFSRVELNGAGPHDFTLVSEGTDVSLAPGLAQLTEGALTGMLEAKQVALGASSRYKDHASWVKKVLGDAQRTIDKQNFLVRGNLENLHRRAGSVLRLWDGRLLAGVGPSQHALFAFGSADPSKMGGSTYYLIEGVRDNISMARQFGIDIPRVRFAKKKTSAAGQNIAVVALESARKIVPSEFASLLDDRGELRIAMAFPARAGGAMVVVGPSAEKVLATWLEQTKSATTGAQSTGDFAAATFAVDPDSMTALGNGDLGKLAGRLLSLDAKQAPTSVVVRRQDARYEVRVKGPKLDLKPTPTRAASGSPRRTPRSRSASTAGKPTTPSSSPGRAKPIRG